MKMLKRNWWKVLCIIIVSAVINMGLHAILTPDDIDNLSGLNFSYFVNNDLVMQGIVIWELLAYTTFALVFILIQDNLGGKKWKKGLLYGIAFGGLYVFGMLEAVLLFDSSVKAELVMGLADALAFITSGLLLGFFVGTDSKEKTSREKPMSILIIALFYVAGRVLAYTVWNIDSSFYTDFLATNLWTVNQGLWVGCMYYMLSDAMGRLSMFRHALLFGGVIYGLNWMVNHSFMYVIIAFSFDLLIRSGNDALFVILGVYSYKRIYDSKEKDSQESMNLGEVADVKHSRL